MTKRANLANFVSLYKTGMLANLAMLANGFRCECDLRRGNKMLEAEMRLMSKFRVEFPMENSWA